MPEARWRVPEARWQQRRAPSPTRVLTPPRRSLSSGGRTVGPCTPLPPAEAGASPPLRADRGYQGKGGKGREIAQRLLRNRPPARPRGAFTASPRGLGPARRGGGGMRALPSQARGEALPAASGRRAGPGSRGHRHPQSPEAEGGGRAQAGVRARLRPRRCLTHPATLRPGRPDPADRTPSGFVPAAPAGEPPCPSPPERSAPRRCPHRGAARPGSAPSGRGGERDAARRPPPAAFPPPPRRAERLFLVNPPRVATGCHRSAQPLASCRRRRPAPPSSGTRLAPPPALPPAGAMAT